MKLTVQEILEDLHAAENDCQSLEKKYGVLSEYFYAAYMNGSLEDNGNPDFALWAGAYEVKLDREKAQRSDFAIHPSAS
ncbi:MAG: hypothetical protein ONB45_17760 [candidate division KSB1 bacterium]|nr:hypothetical protein [candidate division KSB1 bacterium]